jgi:hypothetical protein
MHSRVAKLAGDRLRMSQPDAKRVIVVETAAAAVAAAEGAQR